MTVLRNFINFLFDILCVFHTFNFFFLFHIAIVNEQQIRINKLKIELRTEKGRLIAMQKEVADLENSENEADKEKHLQKEIIELQEECKKLTIEVDNRCGSTGMS